MCLDSHEIEYKYSKILVSCKFKYIRNHFCYKNYYSLLLEIYYVSINFVYVTFVGRYVNF
jgi:hypothetical protein